MSQKCTRSLSAVEIPAHETPVRDLRALNDQPTLIWLGLLQRSLSLRSDSKWFHVGALEKHHLHCATCLVAVLSQRRQNPQCMCMYMCVYVTLLRSSLCRLL